MLGDKMSAHTGGRRSWLKRFLPRTLFGRSLMIILVPVLLLQVITVVVFIDRHWSKMTSRLANGVAGEIAVIAGQIEGGADEKEISGLADRAIRHLDLLVSFDRGAELQGQSHKGAYDSIVARTLSKALEKQMDRGYRINVQIEDEWVEISLQLSNGVLHISALESRLFSSSAYVFLLWVVLTSLILFAIALLFMRNQIRPIRRLAVAADRFGKGHDVPAFKPEGAAEVRQAARAFMEMHTRIKRQIDQRTQMLAGVSHDLRTPLTRLRLNLAMLPDESDIRAMRADVEAMENMIRGYLDFARGHNDETTVKCDISGLLETVAETAGRSGHHIETHIEADLTASLRPQAFERCMSNLLDNAGYYGEHIHVSARALQDNIEIIIEDDGPGIDESLYEDVFKPFYRLDESRNSETGGVGLGLSIAKDTVHAHGGRIWLERSPYGGLKVVILLPR